jgi:hypothetical protein
MSITLKRTIDRDILENIFVTALEGGSNYWYYLSEHAVNIIRSYVPSGVEKCLSVAIFMAIELGAEVPINDAEDEDEVLGELSMENIATRLQKLYDDTNYSSSLELEIQGNGDAYSSDVVFQYLVMGEIVFG